MTICSNTRSCSRAREEKRYDGDRYTRHARRARGVDYELTLRRTLSCTGSRHASPDTARDGRKKGRPCTQCPEADDDELSGSVGVVAQIVGDEREGVRDTPQQTGGGGEFLVRDRPGHRLARENVSQKICKAGTVLERVVWVGKRRTFLPCVPYFPRQSAAPPSTGTKV